MDKQLCNIHTTHHNKKKKLLVPELMWMGLKIIMLSERNKAPKNNLLYTVRLRKLLQMKMNLQGQSRSPVACGDAPLGPTAMLSNSPGDRQDPPSLGHVWGVRAVNSQVRSWDEYKVLRGGAGSRTASASTCARSPGEPALHMAKGLAACPPVLAPTGSPGSHRQSWLPPQGSRGPRPGSCGRPPGWEETCAA